MANKNELSSSETTRCDWEGRTAPIGVEVKDCDEVKKETASGTGQAPKRMLSRTFREDNIRYTSTKTSFKFEKEGIAVFVEDMHSAKLNDETILALDENYMQEVEKIPSRQNSPENNLALSKGYSTWSMQSDDEDKAEHSEREGQSPLADNIPPNVTEENDAQFAELEPENMDKKPKIDPFNIVNKMQRRFSLVRTTNEEHRPNKIASKTVKELDVSKYVNDTCGLDETKIGLFSDDDYALTYNDNPDTLPAIFEEDKRFVMVDGLIQLAPEPVKPTFGKAFRRLSNYGSISDNEKKNSRTT